MHRTRRLDRIGMVTCCTQIPPKRHDGPIRVRPPTDSLPRIVEWPFTRLAIPRGCRYVRGTGEVAEWSKALPC